MVAHNTLAAHTSQPSLGHHPFWWYYAHRTEVCVNANQKPVINVPKNKIFTKINQDYYPSMNKFVHSDVYQFLSNSYKWARSR